MALIKWRESYCTGVEQFDMEHNKIVELVNAMYGAIRDKAPQEDVEKLLAEVITYTEYHFENEEKMMEDSGFDGLEEHRQEHQRLKEETKAFGKLLEEDFVTGTRELYRFLREWLMDHILECDMKYSGKLNG